MKSQMRMDFANGYAIDVDWIKDGQVGYRVWPPGVESQGFLDQLKRMPVSIFNECLAEQKYAEEHR